MASHRQRDHRATLGDMFPAHLRALADLSPKPTKTFHRGEVVWLELPQDLTSAKAIDKPESKIRPFVVLHPLEFHIDRRECCVDDVSVLGVDCTSKPYLVEGRPDISFRLPHSDKISHVLLDGLRTVPMKGQKYRPGMQLERSQIAAVDGALDTVLKPEQRFFLSALFNRKSCMPGQIWQVETMSRQGEALVLLRRGRYPVFNNPKDDENCVYNGERVRYTPYTAAFFRAATNVTNLRGMRWQDLDIVALQEHSFVKQVATLTPQTVGILLNRLRKEAGLEPFEYNEPTFRNPAWLIYSGLRNLGILRL